MDSIDFGRALKAPFQDKGWPGKTALGFLWALLVVTSPAIYGAQLEYIMRTANGNEELPDWSDFGGKWVKGFLVAVAGFIYFLPIFIVGAIMVVPGIIAMAVSNGNSGGGLFTGGLCFFWVIALVYGVAVSLLFYAAVVHFAVKGNFGAFFEFSEIIAHVKDGTGYFVAWLWALVIGFIVGAIMSVLSATGIGAILYPAATYLMSMMIGHILGQWAAKSYGMPGLGAPVIAGYPPAQAPGGYAPPPSAYAPPPAPPASTSASAPNAYPPASPSAYPPATPPAYTPPPAPAQSAPPAPDAAFVQPSAPAPAPAPAPMSTPAPEPPAPASEPPADTPPAAPQPPAE